MRRVPALGYENDDSKPAGRQRDGRGLEPWDRGANSVARHLFEAGDLGVGIDPCQPVQGRRLPLHLLHTDHQLAAGSIGEGRNVVEKFLAVAIARADAIALVVDRLAFRFAALDQCSKIHLGDLRGRFEAKGH